MIELTHLVLGPLETNCYFVRDTETGDLVIVDPAWYDPSLEGKVRAAGAGHVKGILLTHCHVDHIAGAAQLKELTGAPLWAPPQEKEFLTDPALSLAYMIPGGIRSFEAEYPVAEGKPLQIGSLSFRVLHTPGHTLDSMSIFYPVPPTSPTSLSFYVYFCMD